MSELTLRYAKRPHAGLFMAKAFLPKSGRDREPGICAVQARGTLVSMLPAGCPPGARGVVHPVVAHAWSMRLMMAVLTQPRFPYPIWRVLQVRNRIVQQRVLQAADAVELTVRIQAWRDVAKGAECDLEATISDASVAFSSVSTFYFRRPGGGSDTAAQAARPPDPPAEQVATWQVPARGSHLFAQLTGDYNGIHWSDAYARKFGFRRAFAHPHRVLRDIVDRLPGVDVGRPLSIDAWYRGPVYYDTDVALAAEVRDADVVFGLTVEGDDRPALIGRVGGDTDVV